MRKRACGVALMVFAGASACSSSSSNGSNACAASLDGNYIVAMSCDPTAGTCSECPGAPSVSVQIDSAAVGSVSGAPVVSDYISSNFGPISPAGSGSFCTSFPSCCDGADCTSGLQLITVTCQQPDPQIKGEIDQEQFRLVLDAQGNLVPATATAPNGAYATYSVGAGSDEAGLILCSWPLSGNRVQP